ncbi:hypothetical protein OIU78_005814, partial [Salix suchowensis]
MIFDIQDKWNAVAAICLCRSRGRSAHSRGESAMYLHQGNQQGKLST